ncbi:MAG: glycosyltransferase [Pirellulaceae bacterium]|nr:glycosyltransferase [Pirellulaceae bacterium]
MIRLVHYLSVIDLEHGGVVRAVLDTCRLLAERGHQVTLMTWDAKDVPSAWFDGPSHVPNVLKLRRPTLPGAMLSRRALADVDSVLGRCDLVQLHVPWDRANSQIARLARKHNLPYIVTTHGMLDDWSMAQRSVKKWFYNRVLGRRLLEHAAVVHCTAETEMDQAYRWFPRGRSVVLPCVVDFAPFEKLPGPQLARRLFPAAAAEQPRILFLSRLHVKKGADLLFKAGAILRKRGLDFRMLVAGPGESRYVASLKDLVKALGLSDQVVFLGMVQGEVKRSLYQAADLLVLPSHQENFGIVLVEAMACGTPVITTRGTKIWAELQRCGAVIVDRSANAIADAIAGLVADQAGQLAHHADLADLGRHVRDRVFDVLAPERIIAQYETMYAQTLSDSAPT